jgi:hypothetical protein
MFRSLTSKKCEQILLYTSVKVQGIEFDRIYILSNQQTISTITSLLDLALKVINVHGGMGRVSSYC